MLSAPLVSSECTDITHSASDQYESRTSVNYHMHTKKAILEIAPSQIRAINVFDSVYLPSGNQQVSLPACLRECVAAQAQENAPAQHYR